MRDEHLIYEEMRGNRIKIRPQSGYVILCTLSRSYVSEAITVPSKLKYFVSEEE